MNHDEEPEGLASSFMGDDPRPTSKKELAGWYCYGWAAEVFTVCAMGMRIDPLNIPCLSRLTKTIFQGPFYRLH